MVERFIYDLIIKHGDGREDYVLESVESFQVWADLKHWRRGPNHPHDQVIIKKYRLEFCEELDEISFKHEV